MSYVMWGVKHVGFGVAFCPNKIQSLYQGGAAASSSRSPEHPLSGVPDEDLSFSVTNLVKKLEIKLKKKVTVVADTS